MFLIFIHALNVCHLLDFGEFDFKHKNCYSDYNIYG